MAALPCTAAKNFSCKINWTVIMCSKEIVKNNTNPLESFILVKDTDKCRIPTKGYLIYNSD